MPLSPSAPAGATPFHVQKELLLYGICLLSTGAGRRPSLEDLKAVLRTIPRKKYGVAVFAGLEDLRRALEELIAEGLVEKRGGGYAATQRGEAAALEVAAWDTGYAGHMRRVVEKSAKLYAALELLAWAR